MVKPESCWIGEVRAEDRREIIFLFQLSSLGSDRFMQFPLPERGCPFLSLLLTLFSLVLPVTLQVHSAPVPSVCTPLCLS